MAELQNRRHELFAQGLAEGKTADQAYADAGYLPNRCNASRLKTTNENIVRRVEELQKEHRKRHDITVDDLLDEYDENREAAFETSQLAAANGATTGKARLLGLDKAAAPTVNVKAETVKLSDAEAARRLEYFLETGESKTRNCEDALTKT